MDNPTTAAPPPADLRLQRSSRDTATVTARLTTWLAAVLPPGADPSVVVHGGVDANGMSSETVPLDVTWTADPDDTQVGRHVGGGYGGDPDWLHGMSKGEGFAERRDYDIASSEVQGRFMFGVVDHVGRVTCEEAGRTSVGWGLFEHGALGRHDPSGFEDWFTLAP